MAKYYEVSNFQKLTGSVKIDIHLTVKTDNELVEQLENIDGVIEIICSPYRLTVWAGKLFEKTIQDDCVTVIESLEYFPYNVLTP